MIKNNYLLDTNIIVHHQRGYFNLLAYLSGHGISISDCYISEITSIELLIGDELFIHKGGRPKVSADQLIDLFNVLPISPVIETFVKEKCRLQFAGTPQTNNFDLLIGCTAVVHDMTMVTDNIDDFKNIQGIKIENWIR